jgi:GH24 family phage-related lysozyme (muramidase)
MKPSNNFYNIIILLEGLRTKAYQDSKGIWTIGIGTIVYPNGSKVKKGDVCTEAKAYEYLEHDIEKRVGTINGLLIGVSLNQNQFDAICSLAYNIGLGGFASSGVLKYIRHNPSSPEIEDAWLSWSKETKRGIKEENIGLLNRRKKEYQLYSTPCV